MFDIGGPELLVILLGIILLFGPKKIPEVAQMIGKGIQKVRSAQTQFKEQIDEIQSELSIVNNIDPTIKEINAKDLNKEHFSETTISENSINRDSEESSTITNSSEESLKPVQAKYVDELYKLEIPEKDYEESADSHLNGKSHELKG